MGEEDRKVEARKIERAPTHFLASTLMPSCLFLFLCPHSSAEFLCPGFWRRRDVTYGISGRSLRSSMKKTASVVALLVKPSQCNSWKSVPVYGMAPNRLGGSPGMLSVTE